MTVKCYDDTPFVQLAHGPSILEGLVVLDSYKYVCYDGFTAKAAELVCGELGFPAAEEYSAEELPNTAPRSRAQRLSCSSQDSYRFQRLRDCPTTECSSSRAVRVKCREPGFLGCYQGNQQTISYLLDYGSEVHSDEVCISTCRRKPRSIEIALIYRGFCVCVQSKTYADLISEGSFSDNRTCPINRRLVSEERVHYSFDISAGFCNHPGFVTHGHWDSNITEYGSKMTLTCGEGYVINGFATLECVELPGWSTYFPRWNASVPSCQAVKNETNVDTELHTVISSTSTPQITVNTFSKGQSTRDVSIFHETSTAISSSNMQPSADLTWEPTPSVSKTGSTQDLTTWEPTSPLYSRVPVMKLIGYTLGAFLSVVLVVLCVLSLFWRKHRQKSRRGRSHLPNQANNYSDDGQLQIYPVSTATQNATTTNDVDLLDYSSIDADMMRQPIPSRSGGRFGDVTDHQEDPYHIYQDTEEVRNGHSRFGGVDPSSSSTSVGSNMGRATTAVNSSGYHGYQCLQETSLDQPASLYEDCDYQDVDIHNRKDSVTKDDFKSTARACLFDDSCYNSLDFGERSDRVFAQASNVCMDSEYGCIKHATHDDDKQIHDPLPSTTGSTSGRADSMSYSSLSSANIVPSEDLLNKADCKKSHDVDSTYSLIRKDETHGEENLVSLKPEPKPCEQLYATVDKAAKTPSSTEELYTTVDKAAKTPSSTEGLYATVDKAAKTPSSTEGFYATVDKAAKTPSSIEELYAKVDKTRGDHAEVTQPSQEELYMNVNNML
ncbi:uncharacterized protein [Diadema setosum]|uniref:uncharacterized protein n=1 Tax=Diadema setosum TaxID=31175 RepID=UPI003B3B2163